MTPALIVLVGLGSVLAAGEAMDPQVPRRTHTLDWIRLSQDKTHFVCDGTAERVVVWGFDYDRDDAGRLLEDHWADEWDTVAEDFRAMKALGGNVVGVHLQASRFMASADRPNMENLERLRKRVRLAEDSRDVVANDPLWEFFVKHPMK